MVQSIRKQTESEDIVLDLDEKDPEEAAEEETKKHEKNEALEPHFFMEGKMAIGS